jgi:hypothetical protein
MGEAPAAFLSPFICVIYVERSSKAATGARRVIGAVPGLAFNG